MHYTDKECDMSPYMGEYEDIKSVPIVQVGTAYDNTETGDTTILILNEEIWMRNQMENTLVKPKHICSIIISLTLYITSGHTFELSKVAKISKHVTQTLNSLIFMYDKSIKYI